MDYSEFNIQIPNGKYKGEIKTLCPKCSHTRKKKTDKCLSVNLDKAVWNCFNCGWTGFLKNEVIEKKVYVKPIWRNNTELSNRLVKWFEDRGIKQETLKEFRITEGKEFMPQTNKEENTVQFNYFDENNELTNIKFRDGKKNFKLNKDSKLIFYNLNQFRFYAKAFICEGEIDCLTLYQSGYKNVLSVPNGANPKNNNLEYLDHIAERFSETPEIYLCLDNDNPGRRLRDELAERLGKEKCKYVEFKDCKDANDCLQKYGLQGIIESVSDAKSFPLEGVFTIKDFSDDIDDMYVNGLERGVGIGHNTFDRHLTFMRGYITTITGIPGHGKSDFLDEIILRLLLRHNWKTAYYSPENKPTKLHFSKLARKIIGKNFTGNNQMNHLELNMCKAALNDNIWFIKPENDFTLDSILNHVKTLKLTFGIDAFVIDAWNKLEHKYGQSETKYIGESLDNIGRFCEHYNVHCFLVAHPTKINKDKQSGLFEIPNLYNISGSANFYNKTDNGITVYRNFSPDPMARSTDVYIQKVKFAHWGEIGQVRFTYDTVSGRYIEDGSAYSSESWLKLEQQEIEIPANENFLNDIVINNNEAF